MYLCAVLAGEQAFQFLNAALVVGMEGICGKKEAERRALFLVRQDLVLERGTISCHEIGSLVDDGWRGHESVNDRKLRFGGEQRKTKMRAHYSPLFNVLLFSGGMLAASVAIFHRTAADAHSDSKSP